MKSWSLGLTAVLAAGLIGGCVGAGAMQIGTAHAGTSAAPHSVTVFVDATFGFRKNHMASQITDSNEDFEAKGYHFTDMEAYTENGDLQGFFVTYTRN